MDHRNYAAERGPATNDARHRLSASLNVVLPGGVQLGTLLALRSKLPYNITTGADDNRDTQTNDRPAGVGRNAGRGATLGQADGRVTRPFQIGGQRIEVIGEAFNLTNEKNWTTFDGNQRSASFGRPSGGESTRQVQLGVRVDFRAAESGVRRPPFLATSAVTAAAFPLDYPCRCAHNSGIRHDS